MAVDGGSPSRLAFRRKRLGGGGAWRKSGRLRALRSATALARGAIGVLEGRGAGTGAAGVAKGWTEGGARWATAEHWPLHPWDAKACWTRKPAAAVSPQLGTPSTSSCKILTAEANSESIASTSPQPPRHWLKTCSRLGLGKYPGPASSRADKSIRICVAVSPPTRPANTRRASLMTAIMSGADWAPSTTCTAPRAIACVRWVTRLPWPYAVVCCVAPGRPRTLIPRASWRPLTDMEALSATGPSGDPLPLPWSGTWEGSTRRIGWPSPPPRPVPLPRPRRRPRPPPRLLPSMLPSGIAGAEWALRSASRASATAPRSKASTASTARAASSTTRAASAVIASARRRARAT